MNNEEQYANLELGKTYNFMGYKWTACELINNGKTLVIQSHGVTYGEWPGYKMSQFGNGNYYANSIDGQDISDYDDKMRALYDSIKDVEDISSSYGKGLYLVSIEKVGFKEWSMPGSGYYWTALREAVANYSSFGAPLGEVWFGTIDDSNYAFCVNLGDFCYFNSNNQWSSYMVAPTFNLDLSKVEIEGDEIVKKTQPALSSKHDDNCSERPHLGKTYDFMGYNWTACELINNGKTLVIQSHGVTTGPWPGYVMPKFGNGHYYGSDIDGQDISSYDDKTQKLYDAIKDVEDMSATYGKGLYLVSAEKVQLPTIIYGASGAGYYCDAIVSAGSQGNPNGTHCNAWLGTLGNKENTAWFVNCFANGYITFQDDVIKTIAPTFNLDLSKVEIKGDEIIKKAQAAYSPVEQDDNCQEHQLLGKIYKFAGYNWTACELINNGKTLVIQSHGVTHGAWPGFKMEKFGGNADTFYTADIACEDISAYDDKMQALYDDIKDVEDRSATYGKGLYMVSKEKVGFTKWGDHDSGNYWQALKKAAENASSFGAASVSPFGSANGGAWLSAVYGSYYAWFVYSVGDICSSYNQDSGDCVIAPAFNLDLSKVEIKGDEIIKKSTFDFASMAVATPSDNNLSANSNHTSMSAADAKTLFKDFAERLPSDTTLINQVTTNSMIARIKCSKYSTQIANTLNMHFATSNSLYSALSSECSVLPEILLMLQDRGCETHYLGNILLAFIPENVSFPEIDCLYNLPKNSIFTNITVDRSTGEVVIEYNSANNGDAEFFRSLFAVCQGTIKYINIVPRDINTNLFNENYNSCGIHIDSVTDDSAVENRKAQFIIAEQGIAELAGAVTAQSDSSKELTDSSQYRSIWEYGMDLTKDGETFHLDPEMISQIYEAITEDNGRNYVATYTSRKFTREQYIAICDEVENLLTNDSVEYRACENVLGVGFDNYTGQPASDNLPKKLDL